jgi:hypothetical protein
MPRPRPSAGAAPGRRGEQAEKRAFEEQRAFTVEPRLDPAAA